MAEEHTVAFFKAANARSKREKTCVVIICSQANSAHIFFITTPVAMLAREKGPHLRAFSWNSYRLIGTLNQTRLGGLHSRQKNPPNQTEQDGDDGDEDAVTTAMTTQH